MFKVVIVALCFSGIQQCVRTTKQTDHGTQSPTSTTKMSMDLYYSRGSSPCRAVLMTLKALGIEVNLKLTNLTAKEHLKPEFLKINPQHCIPTLVDNGFSICESRAIMTYLVDKYAKCDSLYPKNPEKRSLVVHRLFFDATVLYQRFAEAYYPIVFGNANHVDESKSKRLEDAFDFLNTYLANSEFAAGSNLTIADISLVATVTTVQACSFDLSRYPNVGKWLDRAKAAIPGCEEANNGVEIYKEKYAANTKKQ